MGKLKNILLIDDLSLITEQVIKKISEEGYSISRSTEETRTEKTFKESAPDVVILRYTRGNKKGWMDSCKVIRKSGTVGIITLIAKDDHIIDLEYYKLEQISDDVIEFPLPDREVIARIKLVLRLKKTQLALQESDDRYHADFENLPLGYQSLDINGNFLEVNHALLRTLGYERDEVIGKWFGDFLVADQKELFKTRFPIFKAKGEVIGVDFEMVRKDGTLIFVTFDGKIEYDSLGQFKRTHCILSNVTDKKKAEIALKESEHKFRLLVENAGVGVGYYDVRGNVQYFNNKALHIMGGELKDYLGKNVVELYGKEFGGEIVQRIKKASKVDSPSFYDDQVDLPAGKRWYHSSYTRILDSEGNLEGVQIISDDITEQKIAEEKLKVSEEQFRTVFENSGVGKSLTLITGEIRCNNALARMLGYSQEELNKMTWQQVTPPEDVSSISEYLKPLLNNETDILRFNKRYLCRDGSTLWCDVNVALRRDEDGKPLHFITTVVDITERKKAEEALWEVQRQLQTLMNNLPGMAYRSKVDETWTMTFVSDYCTELTGYQPYDLINNKKISYEKIIHPEDLKLVQKSTTTAPDGKFQLTYRIITADGQTKWVMEQGQRYFDQVSGETFYEGFITDISKQKSAEIAIQQSYDLLAMFVKHSPVYAYVKEVSKTKSRVVFASENFIDMIGIPGSQMTGKSMEELFPLEFAAKMTADDWSVVSKGENLTIEEELNDRSYFTIKYPIRFGDRNLLAGYTVDITALKQTENALKSITTRQEALLGAIPDILMEVNVDKVYTWANRAGMEFFGDDVVGHEAQEYFVGEQNTYDKVQPLFKGDEHTVYIESWQKRRDGEKRLLAWWCRVLKDADGNPIGSLSTARDITDERMAQEEIIALNTRLEQRVEERTRELREAQEKIVKQEKLALLGQLAGGVGHELRNPLGVITNALYYLRMVTPDADDKVKKYLGMIETETHNAEKIISDLLEFARTKSVERQPTAVSDLIKRALLRRPTPMNVNLSVNAPEGLPPVFVDPRQIEQILENLIVNAYQAMPDGGKLTFTVKPRKKGKLQYLSIHVKDSGIGISSEDLTKIFEPLFTTKPKGIGLGLAVCRKLAEFNGGTIHVESEPGKGAEFILELPVWEEK